jgi:DNA-binding IclR family transcriptional regulator
VRAVDRALDVLLCFSHEEPVLSLTRIAEEVGIPKSTVHRLMTTLEGSRFVSRDGTTGMYSLGFRFVEMASVVLQHMDLRRWVQPYLQRLCDECGETVDLAVLDGLEVMYLQVIESPHRIKLAAAVGQRLPAFCTASGKAFLAYLPAEQVRRILDQGLPRHTDHTLTSLPELHQDLEATRQRGFAISEQEYEDDVHAVAAPLLDGSSRPVAVIAGVGPSFRLPRERMLALGLSIQSAAAAIAREIGPVALSTIFSPRASARMTDRAER